MTTIARDIEYYIQGEERHSALELLQRALTEIEKLTDLLETPTEKELIIPEDYSKWEGKCGDEYVVLHIANLKSVNLETHPITIVHKSIRRGIVWAVGIEDWYKEMTRVDG